MKQNYDQAVELYSQAIDHIGEEHETCATYLCNRSMCHLNTEKYAVALEDSEKAIKANPKFIKGYYRKSQALFALGKAKESKQVLLSVVKNLQVNNKDINDRIKILTKIIKE